MRHRFSWHFSIFLAALLACAPDAFSGVPSLDDGRGDPLIRIISLSPVTSTRLDLGAAVTLEVTADYILHDEAGKVALVVRDDAEHIVAETSTEVRQGRAKATLRLPFVVPPSKMLKVKVLLMTSDLKPFAKDGRTYTNIFAGPLTTHDNAPKAHGK